MFAVRPYYMSSSGTINYSQGYTFSYVNSDSFNLEVPLASSIESTMEWCDRVALKHAWSEIGDPLCDLTGMYWLQHDGNRQLNRVSPNSAEPYNITGNSVLGSGFYLRYRDIVDFMGKNTLGYWSPSGTAWPNMSNNNDWLAIENLNSYPKIEKEHYHQYIYKGSRKYPAMFGGFFSKQIDITRQTPASHDTEQKGWTNPLNSMMTALSGVLSVWYSGGYVYGEKNNWRIGGTPPYAGVFGYNDPPLYTGSASPLSLDLLVSELYAPKSIGFSDYKTCYLRTSTPNDIDYEYGSDFFTNMETCFASAFYRIDNRLNTPVRALKHALGLDIFGISLGVSGFYTRGDTKSFTYYSETPSIDAETRKIDMTSDWYGNYKLVIGSISHSGGRLIGDTVITYNAGVDSAEATVIGDKTATKIRQGRYSTILDITVSQPVGSTREYTISRLSQTSIYPYISDPLNINPSSVCLDVFDSYDNVMFIALFGIPFEGSGISSPVMRVIRPETSPNIPPELDGLSYHGSFTSTIKSNILSTKYQKIYPSSEIIDLGYSEYDPVGVTHAKNGWGTFEHHSEWW